jgi:TolB-like protein/DNA-binding SARP family transcriptional activator
MNTASALGSEGRARWSLRLFGGFELSLLPTGEKVAGLGKRERVLLAYLALHPKGREQRRKLTTLLWGDAADETTLDNLRNCLYWLRKGLGDAEHRVLASEGEEIVLDASAFDVDAMMFRRLAAQSGHNELDEAAKLYSGGLLDGLDIESEEYESWRRAEAGRCRDQAVDVLTRLMVQFADAGVTDRAIETGQRLLTLDPLHESAVRRLMRLYTQTGRRSTAIQLYRTLSDALKADLGAQPEAETRALFEEISRGTELPIASTTAGAATTPTAPSLSWPAQAGHPGDEGLIRRPDTRSFKHAAAGKRGWILAGGLAAALVAFFLLYQLAPGTGTPAAQRQQAGAISIAVLPFANLSSDPEQQFFSDGITEEITSALARIPDLGVVGRSSAFQFKGENRDLRAVGQSLGATHLIEGSVRKAGDEVRITAQLIQADNGLHVWTATYDRHLTDIFAIQEEIALAIAGALRTPLGLQPGGALVSNRDIDPESYQQYLRARATIRSNQGRGRLAAIGMIEQVADRYPGYAPAWAQLALGYMRMGVGTPDQSVPPPATVEERRRAEQEWLLKAEAAARRAIELDANLADGYTLLGVTIVLRGNYLQADELFSKALALDPFHPEAMHFYAILLSGVGRVKDALAMRERLISIEPLIRVYNGNIETLFWIVGQTDAAIASAGARRLSAALARMYSAQGRYAEAAGALMMIPPGSPPEGMVEEAVRLLRTAPAAAASPQSLPRLDGNLGFVYLHVGAPERTLQPLEDDLAAGSLVPLSIAPFWHPSYAPARKTERFKAFARSAGLVEYWRAKGWPEFCGPVGADDFTCE